MPESLYQQYTEVRSLALTEEQFGSFLAFFPALLVAASDGIVDSDEWLYCKKLASSLGYSFAEGESNDASENLSLVYKAEFRYLLKHLDQWQEPFLEATRVYLDSHDFAKKFVSETIYLFADASNGVSQEEMDMINNLEKRLALH